MCCCSCCCCCCCRCGSDDSEENGCCCCCCCCSIPILPPPPPPSLCSLAASCVKKEREKTSCIIGFPAKKNKEKIAKMPRDDKGGERRYPGALSTLSFPHTPPRGKSFFSFSRKITLSFSWEWRAVEEQQQQQRRHSTAPPCHTSRHGGDGPTERLFFLFPYPPHTSDRHANNECALSRLLSLVREIRPTPKQSCKSAE